MVYKTTAKARGGGTTNLYVEPRDPEISTLTREATRAAGEGDAQIAVVQGIPFDSFDRAPSDVTWRISAYGEEVRPGLILCVRSRSGALYKVEVLTCTPEGIEFRYAPLLK